MVSRKYFSGVFIATAPLSVLVRIHNSMVELSAVHDFEYRDHRNFPGSSLYKDELLLL